MSRFLGIVVLTVSAVVSRVRRLFRRAPRRSTQPEFMAGEVGSLLVQLALSRIGGARLTMEECLTAVKRDRRTCTESFAIQHLRGTARAVPPLRAVIPLEACEGLPPDAPSPITVRRRRAA